MKSKLARRPRRVCICLLLLTLFFSIKSQAQWTIQNSGTTAELTSVYFLNPDTGFVAGESVTIFKTTDGGTNWQPLSTGVFSAFDAVVFTNVSTGYAFGRGSRILKTTNAGANWFALNFSGGVGLFFSAYFTNDRIGYAVGSGIKPSIIKTTDGGINWTVQRFDSITTLYSIHFPTADTGYAVGSTNYEEAPILKTTDAGNSWFRLTSGVDPSLRSVYFTDANTGYAVGSNGTILKTTDGGTAWIALNSGTSFVTFTSVYFPDDNTGYAVTGFPSDGSIFKTIDAGESWHLQNPRTTRSLNDIFFVDTNIGYAVGDDGVILKTLNGGVPVGIEQQDTEGIPAKYSLDQNYPNPFNPVTTIRFHLPTASSINLSVYDVFGCRVGTLVNERLQAGAHTISWNAADISSGVYFFKLEAGAYSALQKGILLK